MEVLSQDVELNDKRALNRDPIQSKSGDFAVIRTEEIFENYIPKRKAKRSHTVRLILRESNFQVLKYILSHLDFRRINKVLLTDAQDLSSKNMVEGVKFLAHENNVRAIVDFKKANNTKDLNGYFAAINDILPMAGIYISCVETHRQRNRRIQKEKGKLFATFLMLYEFVLYRIFPKIRLLKSISNKISQGKLPVLSLAETLGRLVYSGFDIIEYKNIRNLTYIVVIKTNISASKKIAVSNALEHQKKISYSRKIKKHFFSKYHAYAEYLPDYILHLNGQNPSISLGKDFRYNVIGRILYGTWKQIVLEKMLLLIRLPLDLYRNISRSIVLPKIRLEDIFYIKNSLGKNGQLIKIYKFRTMVRNADKMDNIIAAYNSHGNPIHDPRITRLGRFMRKVWIDELPQLYSLIKGDVRLVGIRPMRECDWDRYPVELKEKALRFKPGLIGIQYGTMVKRRFEEHIKFLDSYLNKKMMRPFLTDFKFFFKVFFYIFFKGVRSE